MSIEMKQFTGLLILSFFLTITAAFKSRNQFLSRRSSWCSTQRNNLIRLFSENNENADGFRIFGGIKFTPPMSTALERLGINDPTPIQEAAIGPLLAGTSSILHAATGTGKTFAYILPALKRLYSHKKSNILPMQMLVVVPTKELAVQVASDIVSLTNGDSSMVHLSISTHKNGFNNITAPIVVGTSYKIFDNLEAGGTVRVLANIEYLVLDEVDRLIPALGKYATYEKKQFIRGMKNPTIDIIHQIVRAKVVIAKYQHGESIDSLDILKYLQVVAASATVGRSLRRELYRLFQSESAIKGSKLKQDSNFQNRDESTVAKQYGGQFSVIRPAGSMLPNDSGKYENTGADKTITRAVGIPSGIRHIALLDNDEASTLAGKLTKVKKHWMSNKQAKRGIVFVPTAADISEAIGILRFWGISGAVDLQNELGIFSRNPGAKSRRGSEKKKVKKLSKAELKNKAVLTPLLTTEEILQRARDSRVGSISRDEDNENLYEESSSSPRTLYVLSVSGSRGLHLQDIEMVFMLFPPRTMDEYLHAAGRTGRSGNRAATGTVYTIATPEEIKRLTSWQTPLGIKFHADVEG